MHWVPEADKVKEERLCDVETNIKEEVDPAGRLTGGLEEKATIKPEPPITEDQGIKSEPPDVKENLPLGFYDVKEESEFRACDDWAGLTNQSHSKDSVKEELGGIEEMAQTFPAIETSCDLDASESKTKIYGRVPPYYNHRKLYSCASCNRRFSTKRELREHFHKRQGDCLLVDSKQKTREELLFTCSLCEYTTKNPYAMKEHNRKHTGEKPYKCRVCEYTSASKSNVNRHEKLHAGKKLHICDFCCQTFGRRDNLKAHKMRHTAEKHFACDTCEFKTYRKDNLSYHMQSFHKGKLKAIHSCGKCEFTSNYANSLTKHMKTHHKPEPSSYLRCSMCDYSTTRPDTLKVHVRRHTGERPYVCDTCSYKTTTSSNLRVHRLRHHRTKLVTCATLKAPQVEGGLVKHRISI